MVFGKGNHLEKMCELCFLLVVRLVKKVKCSENGIKMVSSCEIF